MNINGIYWMKFEAATGGWGDGIIVLEDGKIRGGDIAFAFIGKYQINDDLFHAEVVSHRYSEGVPGALGVGDNLSITLNGTLADPKLIEVLGRVDGAPEEAVQVTLTFAHGLEMFVE